MRTSLPFFLAAFAIVGLGCASAPEPAPSAGGALRVAPAPARIADPSSPAPALKLGPKARRAALRYKVNGDDFPLPLVDVVIAGFPTSMIVDTGASHHVIADWVAKEIAVPVTTSGDRAVDHAGRAQTVGRAENVKLSISGWNSIEVPLVLVLSMPGALQHLGIGGVLAPHLLAGPGHATLLDLRGGAMVEEAEEEAAKHEVESGGTRAITSARVCGGATEGVVLVVQAAAFGEPAWLKLDSGAMSSSLFERSAAGKRALAQVGSARKEYGAAGSFTSLSVPGARVMVGEFEAAVELGVESGAPAANCPSDGFLGMDVLRSCVVVLRGDRTSARCGRRAD